MRQLNRSTIIKWIPKRPRQAHKGSCGRVLIVAGSRGMSGAAVLSALGAVRAGAGMVRVATVKSAIPIVAKRAPLEVTLTPLPESSDGQISTLSWAVLSRTLKTFAPDVVAVGPGLGLSKGVQSVVENLISKTTFPLLMDADGLNVLAVLNRVGQRKAPWILTPHPGEMGRLLKQSTAAIQADRERAVAQASDQWGAVCLLKGAGTLIAQHRSVWKNPTGTPAMASAGMGDVLTGIIAALWSQYPECSAEEAIKAACVGAYIHGLSAELVFKRKGGLSVLASDVAENLPSAFQQIFKYKKGN